jgi:hypothetical protein
LHALRANHASYTASGATAIFLNETLRDAMLSNARLFGKLGLRSSCRPNHRHIEMIFYCIFDFTTERAQSNVGQ